MPKDGGDSEIGIEETIDHVGILELSPNKIMGQELGRLVKGPTKPTRRSVSKFMSIIDT